MAKQHDLSLDMRAPAYSPLAGEAEALSKKFSELAKDFSETSGCLEAVKNLSNLAASDTSFEVRRYAPSRAALSASSALNYVNSVRLLLENLPTLVKRVEVLRDSLKDLEADSVE